MSIPIEVFYVDLECHKANLLVMSCKSISKIYKVIKNDDLEYPTSINGSLYTSQNSFLDLEVAWFSS